MHIVSKASGKGGVVLRPFSPTAPAAVLDPAGLLARALNLLRPTGMELALFRICFGGLGDELAAAALAETHGSDGLSERLSDGSWALLLIGLPGVEMPGAERIGTELRTVLDTMGGEAAAARPSITAVHHHGHDIGEAQEVVAELLAQRPPGAE
jgi:hypothetical protein